MNSENIFNLILGYVGFRDTKHAKNMLKSFLQTFNEKQLVIREILSIDTNI
jgi:hypothetical protein